MCLLIVMREKNVHTVHARACACASVQGSTHNYYAHVHAPSIHTHGWLHVLRAHRTGPRFGSCHGGGLSVHGSEQRSFLLGDLAQASDVEEGYAEP